MNPEKLQKITHILLALKAKLKCPICLDLVENTVELECSHHFCSTCLQKLRLQNSPLCPLCKFPINKRAPVFKDCFADALKKFVDRSSQLVKETYAHDIHVLPKDKEKLQEIIDTAPQDVLPSFVNNKPKLLPCKKPIEDPFSKLVGPTTRSYVNKKKREMPKVLHFTDNDTKTKIINWLSDNQEKFDTITQSSNFVNDDEADFELPSISQVPLNRKQKPTNRVRSQSLISLSKVADHNEPLLKRYHSLTQDLIGDDYDIEEIQSETIMKEVERQFVQKILEVDCIVNYEQIAKQSKTISKKEKATPSKKGKKSVEKNKSSHIPNSGTSSGWDRIKDVKKSINKATKEPKKLNISLQETVVGITKKNDGTKADGKETARTIKSPNVRKKASPEAKATKTNKKSSKESTMVDNKENENLQKVNIEVDIPKEQSSHVYNLSAVEKYFEKNIDKVKVTPDKNTSSDMEIDVINNSKSILERRQSLSKQNASSKDKSFDEDIFLLPTQQTPLSAKRDTTICFIAPVPDNYKNIDIIAASLKDNLQCCISSATNLNDRMSYSLTECFTNLKTYIDKILKHRSETKEQGMQTSEINHVSKSSTATQTNRIIVSSVAAQTILSPVKEVSSKQTRRDLQESAAQTDNAKCVDQGVQVHMKSIIKEKSVEKIITHSLSYSSSPPNPSKNGLRNKNVSKQISKHTSLLTQTVNLEKTNEENLISTKTSQRSSQEQQEHHISEDSSKSNAKSGTTSQNSDLICSMDSNTLDKKTNKKLNFGETQNRMFKRIRKPASDSESDEDGQPSKRKFVRDDLTVEFLDTEKISKDNGENEKEPSPDSEKMDYDKYLIEVMARYGTPLPENTLAAANTSKSKNDTTLNKKQNSEETSKSQKRKSQRSQVESQSQKSREGSGDNIFTANVALEENLDKFDKEIFEYEQQGKAQSTEYDLVEDTPMISPKPKIPRLQTSNKKRDLKKDNMKEPLQILSKGSASSSSTSRRQQPLEDEFLNNFTQREASTLNRNIENAHSQTEKCTYDVAGILEDLRNDDDFFKSNMEYEDKEPEKSDLSQRRTKYSNELRRDITMADDIPEGVRESTNAMNVEKPINVTQENIDKVLENLNDFDDDVGIEAELEKISFTAEQRKIDEVAKRDIKILQNIKLKSQDKPVAENGPNEVIESSDVSDEELVETTPQKKKNSSKERSMLDELNNTLDFCLPPPPGFGDEIESSPLAHELRESPKNDDGCKPVEGNKSSLTPDRLSDFIVTPDTNIFKEATTSPHKHSQQSMTFKSSFVTPNRPSKGNRSILQSTPRVSQVAAMEPDDYAFSPIAKSTIKFSQTKYTPLVTTSRLSTKKSNLMTSTPNQKSILNYVKPSQESPSQKPKPCIMWSRIVNKDLNIFTQLEVKKLVTTASSFSSRVTHLVVLVDEKGQIVSHTAKILIAIAAGIWVVRYEWAQDCLKLNRIVPEEPYEALDSTGAPGPQLSRLTRTTTPLFRGFRFYCAPPLLTLPKSDLEKILQLAGGEVVRDINEFLQEDDKINIILTESSASEDMEQFENFLQIYKAATIDVEWLTKCIGQYKLVSFRAFLVSGDDSIICDLGYPPTLVESVPFTLTEAM